ELPRQATSSRRLRLCAPSRSRDAVRRRATGPGNLLPPATSLRPEPEQRRSPTPSYRARQTISYRLRLCAPSRSRGAVRVGRRAETAFPRRIGHCSAGRNDDAAGRVVVGARLYPQAASLSTDSMRVFRPARTKDEAACMTEFLDVPGLVRRARRIADVSQREMASAAQVSPTSIARAESAGRVTLDVLERVLTVAGLRLVVIDGSGDAVHGMRPDAVRDRSGRRLPAHLDPFPYWGVGRPYRADRP